MSLFGSRKIGFFGGGGGGGSTGTVSGTGVTNYLALWDSATTITQSRILDNPSSGQFVFENEGIVDGLRFNFNSNIYNLGINGIGISASNYSTILGDFGRTSGGVRIEILNDNENNNRLIRTYINLNAQNGLNLDFYNYTYQLGNWNTTIAGNNKSVLSFYQDYFKFTTKNTNTFMYVENGQWGIGDVISSSNGYALQSDGVGLLYTQANNSTVGFYMINDQAIKFGSDNNGTYIDVNDNTSIIDTYTNGNKFGFSVDFGALYTLLGVNNIDIPTDVSYIKLDSNSLKTTLGTNSLSLDDSGSGALILNDSGVISASRNLKITINSVDYIIPLWSSF